MSKWINEPNCRRNNHRAVKPKSFREDDNILTTARHVKGENSYPNIDGSQQFMYWVIGSNWDSVLPLGTGKIEEDSKFFNLNSLSDRFINEKCLVLKKIYVKFKKVNCENLYQSSLHYINFNVKVLVLSEVKWISKLWVLFKKECFTFSQGFFLFFNLKVQIKNTSASKINSSILSEVAHEMLVCTKAKFRTSKKI